MDYMESCVLFFESFVYDLVNLFDVRLFLWGFLECENLGHV